MEDSIINLYKQGKSLKQVADIVGCHKSRVWRTCRKVGIIRSVSEASKGKVLSEAHRKNISKGLRNSDKKIGNPRKSLNSDYKELTSELAYIVGVLFGDGYIYSQGIGLEVIDKDFADEFARCVKIQFGEVNIYYIKKKPLLDWRNGKTYQRKPTYMIRFGSIVAKEFLKIIETVEWVSNLPTALKIDFLRGLWDSDGCYSSKVNQILFYNKDENIIKLYANILKELLNIQGRYYKQSYNDVFKYYFGTGKNTLLFFQTIKPTIQRKLIK